ncbi:MAG: lipocalin family protein [Lachnospiraceae bacterium]|nr:lipocalin family protein [Lachnospiraceae bacterium]
MRKFVTALMLTVAMMVLAGCGGGGSKDPVVGNWKMTEIETMGVKVSLEEYMQSMGGDAEDMSMEMDIKEDGTFSGKFASEEGSGTWKYSAPTLTLTADGEDMKCEYKDGKLVMNVEEGGQSFSAVFEK